MVNILEKIVKQDTSKENGLIILIIRSIHIKNLDYFATEISREFDKSTLDYP